MGNKHIIVDNDEQSNTDNESKEHDSGDILTYTRSKGKDKDKDNGEQYYGELLKKTTNASSCY